MKILNVFPSYEPAWAFGGVVRCTSNLCRAMAKAGADASVYTTNVDGQGGLLQVPLQTPVDLGGVRVTYFPSTFGKNSVWDSRALTRSLDKTIADFDILYVAAIWQWMGLSVGRIARRHGIPYIVGAHGSFHPATLEKGWLKKRLYWHLFLKSCIKGASALHFTTEYERRVSKGFLPNVENFVVPNTVAVERFTSSQSPGMRLRRKYGIESEVVLLLTVVRPDPAKRLDVMIQAFEKIARSVAKTKLLIVGPCDNVYMVDMKKLAGESGVGDKIIWMGYQSSDDLVSCYRESDLFLLTSAHENFSMAAVEAMAAGLPVVVTDRVGVAEDVKRHQAGIVTEVNAEQVAQAVIDLLRYPSRLGEMGHNASDAAGELYRGQRVAGLMLKAFEDILSQSRSPACAWQ